MYIQIFLWAMPYHAVDVCVCVVCTKHLLYEKYIYINFIKVLQFVVCSGVVFFLSLLQLNTM